MSTRAKQPGYWIRKRVLGTRPERRSEALHIVGLSALAFAQPTFDILSRNGTFFVAHRSTAADILWLVLVLVAGIPFALIALTRAIGALSATGYRVVHTLVIFLLAGFTAAPPIARTLDLGSLGWAQVFLAVGGMTAFVYSRRRHFYRGFTVLAATPVFVIVIFLFSSPVRQIIYPSTVGTLSSTARSDTPVVIVLFDGLSLGSLLTPEGEVNAERYPNFGELADSATWYSATSTVGQSTFHAVPALLTGRWPRQGTVPNARDHPQNLFVALGSAYKMNVREWVTQLCPPRVCKEGKPVQRSILLEDSAIVLGHLVLPSEVAKASLPPIDDQWAGFRRTSTQSHPGGSRRKDRSSADARRETGWTGREQIVTRFDELLDVFGRPASSSLWFTHIGIPHAPWQFLQTGQSYLPKAHPRVPGLEDGTWAKNQLLVTQGLQRYLLQVKASDRLLGALVDRLKKTNNWDDALLIVTADHGTAFIPGRRARVMDDRSAAQLLPVPLFIKYPGQREGITDRRFTELVDVMPTILDVLHIDVPWKLDGASLRSPEHARPHRRVYLGRSGFREFDPVIEGIDEISRRIHAVFGIGGDRDDLFNFGSRRLVGRQVSAVSNELRQMAVEVDTPAAYRAVEPGSTFVPAMLEATVKDNTGPSVPVAVSLNGRVAGMGWTYREGTRTRITVMLAPRHFARGENEVRVFEILSPPRS